MNGFLQTIYHTKEQSLGFNLIPHVYILVIGSIFFNGDLSIIILIQKLSFFHHAVVQNWSETKIS